MRVLSRWQHRPLAVIVCCKRSLFQTMREDGIIPPSIVTPDDCM